MGIAIGRPAVSMIETVRHSVWTLQEASAAWAAPGHVRSLQGFRVRRLLKHAVTKSPFYRDKFRGIDPARCSLADLPTTTKAELMADFDRVVTDPAVRRADLERFVD